MWEQFKQLLDGMEDGDIKTNLLSAFPKLKEDRDNAIVTRDKAKDENKPLKELVESIGKVTGLGNDFGADKVKELISSKSNGGKEVETLQNNLKELRDKYAELEGTHKNFVSKSNEKEFELALSNSEILKNVSSDPFLRGAVIETIKPKLMRGEDGQIYAKGEDGKVMTDIVTSKPITGTALFDSMVKSGQISKVALNATVVNGTGKPQNSNGGGAGNGKVMSRSQFEGLPPADRSKFFSEGGTLTDD